uniref:Uncharacterized protein n=1 Tax=Haemonchus contortus TaxID=6289 RepID=A0A7I4Z0U3_HAECO
MWLNYRSYNLRCLHANIELRGGRAVAFHIDLERLELIRQRGAARAVPSDQPRPTMQRSDKGRRERQQFWLRPLELGSFREAQRSFLDHRIKTTSIRCPTEQLLQHKEQWGR